jgi:hypothetical protein
MKTPMVSPRQIKYTNCVEVRKSSAGCHPITEVVLDPSEPRERPSLGVVARTCASGGVHQAFLGTSATSRIEVDSVSS